MPVQASSCATLRTKTGCLTCRKRRKKCDETLRPSQCERCAKSNRPCIWPTQDELFDRRHRRSPKASSSPSPSPDRSSEVACAVAQPPEAVEVGAVTKLSPFFVCREIGFRSDLFNSRTFESDLEVACFRHFVDGFLPLLLLSNSHPGFTSHLVPEIVQMLLQFDGMRNVILACGASHMHLITGSAEMNKAGIKYYSRAVSEVHRTVSRIDWDREDFNDALLLAVVLLYIHGVFTIDTNKDISKHVMGAIQLMKLREAHSHRPPMPRPIHRIIWESILYQIFRQTVNRPFAVGFQPDIEFCATAEETLQSLTFPDASPADNSPVIGFPLSLQSLIIQIVQVCKGLTKADPAVLQTLSFDMQRWESTILEEGHCLRPDDTWSKKKPSERARDFHQHSTSLHVLAASLLLDWAIKSQEEPNLDSPLPPTGDSWQVRRGLEILRCPQAHEEWSRCYLGSWPTMIFGYAVDRPDDIALIRNDLRERFQKLCSAEELLFLEELEYIWHLRGITDKMVDWVGHRFSQGATRGIRLVDAATMEM